MFRNIKACKRLAVLLLPLFLIAVLVFEPSSRAQISGCPGNLIQNGDFSTGVVAVGNGNFPPSTVPNWSTAFGTPQIVASMGCGNLNFVKMWGNQTVGEGIKQTVNIQAGHTYRLSACVRVDTSNPVLPNYVRFNVRAWSNPNAITYTGAAPVIGLTGNITATTWTPVTLANWTAPANLNTITINPENDNTDDDGNTVSWGWIDNVCLQEVFPACFKATTACQGQPTAFTSCATNATSWSWNFGDGTSSNQQNPTHIYSTPGPFSVTHCVNGTNCVTNPVTVKAAPPAPVITGPNNVYAGQTVNYSVGLGLGLSYSWTVTGGTIIGPTTGAGISVLWTGSSGGSVAVTVTNKDGCSSTSRLAVGSDLFQCESCKDLQSKTDLTSFGHTGNGVYNVTPSLSVNLQNVVRVTANVISSTATYSPLACGTAGPVNSHVMSASNVGNLVATVPLTGGHEVIWHGPPTSVNGQSFPMKIKFPPPPTGKCRDALTFCVKYTFTTKDCKTCEVIRCYGPFKRNELIKTDDDIKIITLTP
jgi:PKD repeat protein